MQVVRTYLCMEYVIRTFPGSLDTRSSTSLGFAARIRSRGAAIPPGPQEKRSCRRATARADERVCGPSLLLLPSHSWLVAGRPAGFRGAHQSQWRSSGRSWRHADRGDSQSALPSHRKPCKTEYRSMTSKHPIKFRVRTASKQWERLGAESLANSSPGLLLGVQVKQYTTDEEAAERRNERFSRFSPFSSRLSLALCFTVSLYHSRPKSYLVGNNQGTYVFSP